MKRIQYISRFARPLSNEEVDELAQKSEEHNAKIGVTGFLLCLGDIFFRTPSRPIPEPPSSGPVAAGPKSNLLSIINRLVLGLLAAALFVGSAMILSSSVPPLIQGVSVLGALGCLFSFSMAFRLVRAIQRSGNIESK